MGQAKKRKEELGDLYGTPAGSNRSFIVYDSPCQEELDSKLALPRIQAFQGPVILIGTYKARPLAKAAGIRWFHELTPAEALDPPERIAWDPMITLRGGDCPKFSGELSKALCVLGAGTSDIVKDLGPDAFSALLPSA